MNNLCKKMLLAGMILFPQHVFSNVSVTLTTRQLCDLELLLNEGFAPLKGFMKKADYETVVERMRLADGTLWPMPITLDVSEEVVADLQNDPVLSLKSAEGDLIATMAVEEAWQPDKNNEVQKVYGTQDMLHPGTAYILKQTKPFYVGGQVTKVALPQHYDFNELRKTPAELKQYFATNGIKKIVAFQTRNPMHRAHVELTQRAAQQADAHLLVHPVVGLTKPGDVDHFTRVRCYKKLMQHYPAGSATLAVLPLAMRMAGPREAVWHAIIRKNYGATHFIVGRDHAGPGKDSKGVPFYGPYDAQTMVAQYAKEIGIEMMPFSEMMYVPADGRYHSADELAPGTKTMSISGTELRDILRDGKEIPAWFSYPEVAEELRVSYPPKNKQGFTIFFTGLSGAGKSTITNALALKLAEVQDRRITILDGDEVRKHISAGLGFSKADRSANIRRMGFVANEITKNGGVALCAFVSPYNADRDYDRALIGNFIEVYVSTPIEACEQRDVKGLYKKAREGKIPEFTGVSDPYEEPLNPELTIDTTKTSVQESLEIIVNYLKQEGYIN
ncbi:bifunctional sulfate adenylyltransferase/adenylylsulfate kinase [Candidatus Dependentiae bacterium]|nr:bifunctional sulfate adenylyltransferase/adenylylsulfate kinase [Candidatus Dependentiae bacterium]